MVPAHSTRTLIVEAADDLFYRHGFDHTSFADVADKVGISRGNFYYHFRTKDEILSAVISRRLAQAEARIADWEAQADTPQDRLKLFIRILIRNQDKVMQHGCPIGTLCNELAKLDHAAQPEAQALFRLYESWLTQQFSAMAWDQAATHARHLLAMSQGLATLANAYKDPACLTEDVTRLCHWIDSLTQKEQ